MFASLRSLINNSAKSTDTNYSAPSSLTDLSKEGPKVDSIQSFDDLVFLKKITKAKFAVYLVKSSSNNNKRYALKAFPFQNDCQSIRYENEVRFACLSHPNIVSIVHHKADMSSLSQVKGPKMSYILMEYAPYGDFFDFVMNYGIEWDDKLVRTYFHQLISGIEYMHSQGACHLDLKLENLLMGENFILKIADFDLAYMKKDGQISTKGTKNYRAYELISKTCEDPQAADIYSAAIILFVMKCEGVLPYLEDQDYKGINLYELLHHQPEVFWQKHCQIQNKGNSCFDKSFKSLFTSMTRTDPCARATVSDIKSSKWYQGPVYSKKELAVIMEEAWLTRN